MDTPIKSTPKDVFLHLFNILTFYLSAVGAITLYIQYIAALFPDPLNYYFYGISQTVRWATSVLFISVPAYLLTSWFLSKDLAAAPAKRELKLRKWLIYFTLFVSAVTIIIDLMIFVYNFLNGELTIQFGLKILVVLLIAAAVFGYYLWELKRGAEKTSTPKILAGALGILALGSIVAGFFIVGTPGDQRKLRFDDQRANDLQNLVNEINNFWSIEEKLPLSLSDLNAKESSRGYSINTIDPQTKTEYEYRPLEKLDYELCAEFSLPSDAKVYGEKEILAVAPYGSPYGQTWKHKAGRSCFKRTVDPAMFKPQKVQVVD